MGEYGKRQQPATDKSGLLHQGLKKVIWSTVAYVILIISLIISILPFVWMWSSALKPGIEIMRNPFALPTTLYLNNLQQAWTVGKFNIYFQNSIIISILWTTLVVGLSCLAGYSFARLLVQWRWLLLVFLLGLLLPVQAVMIPLYFTMSKLSLLDTHWSVILAGTGLSLPFGIFMMRQFFIGMPRELEDAARIDGCSEIGVFLKVMLPLAKPAILTLTIFNFMWSWNNFLLPLLFIYRELLRPLPLGLMFFRGRYTLDLGMVAAGVTISTLPIVFVYLAFQRQFTKGITAGALKG